MVSDMSGKPIILLIVENVIQPEIEENSKLNLNNQRLLGKGALHLGGRQQQDNIRRSAERGFVI